MSIAFKTLKIASGSNGSVSFEGTVNSASAAIQSFHAWYLSKGKHPRPVDHHLQDMKVFVDVISITGGTVKVQAFAGFSDNSNDESTGEVTALVIADLS